MASGRVVDDEVDAGDAFRCVRMLRPSRPMMRPFISSLGSGTTETVDLGGMVGRAALDGGGDDLAGVGIGLVLDCAARSP